MRDRVPVLLISANADRAGLHADTDPPSAGIPVWAPPDEARPLDGPSHVD